MCCLPTHLRAALVTALAIAALALSAPAQGNAGDLDPTFGSGGIVLSNLDTVKGSSIQDVATQPDGRVVALERGFSDARHVLRYRPDGSLDPSFDFDGIAAIPGDVWANAVAVQADGKVVVSGSDPAYGFVVMRFLASGELDPDFDGDSGNANGIVRTKLTAGVDQPTSLVVDGQGRILVAGNAGSAPATSDVGVLRLLPDGRLDKSFAGDGTLVYDTPVEVRINDVAVQGDGKVIVAGSWGSYPTSNTMVQRFTEGGATDAFGGFAGRKIIDKGGNDRAWRVALQPGGRVLVGVKNGSADRLIRLTDGGDEDAGFGSGGEVPLTSWLESLALAPDGKIVLGGVAAVDGIDRFAVDRRTADGAPDPAFGGGSPVLTAAVKGESASGQAIAVASDANIVFAGHTGISPGARGVLLRLKGQPDPVAPPVSPPGTTEPAADPLTLSGLKLTNRLFAVGRTRTARVGQAQAAARRKRGTTFAFRLSQSATVSIRIKRRAKTMAVLRRTAQAGGNRVRFSGRVGRRALRPGRYRATLTAVDAAGKRSNPATVSFRIVRG